MQIFGGDIEKKKLTEAVDEYYKLSKEKKHVINTYGSRFMSTQDLL